MRRLRSLFERKGGPSGCGRLLVDHPLISERLFFPRRGALGDTFNVDCGSARLACYRCVRHPNAGTLLHFHGNGETVADYATDFADSVLAMGINVCLAEYRGYGDSTGTPALGAMLGDGEYIIKALGEPPERLAVYGRSLGSVYAIEVAHRHPGIAGLIVESGIADVLERLRLRVQPGEIGCTEADLAAEVARLFDHRAKLGKYRGPFLVLHSEGDSQIHRSHAERNHAWGGGSEKELVVFPKGDHNSMMVANLSDYRRTLASFLDRVGLR